MLSFTWKFREHRGRSILAGPHGRTGSSKDEVGKTPAIERKLRECRDVGMFCWLTHPQPSHSAQCIERPRERKKYVHCINRLAGAKL